MIAIINKGESKIDKGIYYYRVQINNELIAVFSHKRNDGLATCLERAAHAVREQQEKELREEG